MGRWKSRTRQETNANAETNANSETNANANRNGCVGQLCHSRGLLLHLRGGRSKGSNCSPKDTGGGALLPLNFACKTYYSAA